MRSLRRFLLLTSLPLIAVVGLVAAAIGYDGSRHEADEVFDAQMAQYARLLANALPAADGASASIEPPAPGSTRAGRDTDAASATGHDYETRLTFQYWVDDRLVARSRYAPALPVQSLEPGYRSIHVDGRRWRVFTLELDQGRRVIVTEDEYVRDEIALALAGQALLPLVIGLPVLGLLLWFVIELAVRRIDSIARDVAARSPTDLSPVSTAHAPREMSHLLDAINGLLERLRGAIEREQQFSADAAHELRTPITGMRIHLQNARLAAAGDADLEASLQQAEQGVDRMLHIVEQLLRFNRAVNREEQVGTEAVALEQVLAEVVELQRPLVEQRGQELTTALGAARATGNRELLAIVFGNLLANASQYTPAGGTIHIAVADDAGGARVTVEDAGPGMPQAQRAGAFARFHRGDGDRHAGAGDGCGLGLAIAERICERHGAAIELSTSQTLGGLRAEVRFPPVPPGRAAGPPRA